MNKVALLFSGQGSQYVGMGKYFFDNFPITRKVYEEASDILKFDLQKLCFEGTLDELTKTKNAQPAILVTSVAIYKVFMNEIGIVPTYFTGHSLGEISALTCAGAIEFGAGVRIARRRGEFMEEAGSLGSGAMSAVTGLHRNIVNEELKRVTNGDNSVVISNYNAPEQSVISGHQSAVSKLGEILESRGANVMHLKVSTAFHSPMMLPAAEYLKEELSKYQYKQFSYPVISNVTALPYREPQEIIEYLTTQMTSPVKWQESIEYLESQGVATVVEIGPGTVLRNLTRKISTSMITFSCDNKEDLKELLAKAKSQTSTVITRCLASAICVPNDNSNNTEYYNGVIVPYRKIQQIQNELDEERKEPSIEQMKKALLMLKSVFATKKLPVEEQILRFNRLLDETGTKDIFPQFQDIKA